MYYQIIIIRLNHKSSGQVSIDIYYLDYLHYTNRKGHYMPDYDTVYN